MKQRQTSTTRQPLQADPTDTSVATTPTTVSLLAIVPESCDGNNRHGLIATEAYLLAERRGFVPGSELEDWLAAEHAVDTRLCESTTIGDR